MAKKVQDALKDIISLCKRRGFIFPGSEIYDGLANTWDYGPYGNSSATSRIFGGRSSSPAAMMCLVSIALFF